MTLSRDDIIAIAKKLCGTLDGATVCAVIEQESMFSPWAHRVELDFEKKYLEDNPSLLAVITAAAKRLDISVSTEQLDRAFSWGVMQVMGQTARETGFLGPLPQLCDPEIGINVGCEVLRGKFAKANGDLRTALQLWNGGSNPKYADEVMARIPKFQ